MSRLRSLDSKISFFAFADIITAVSGVLIFIALLLATDLGRPANSRSQAAHSLLEQKLQATLAQQVGVDAQNHRLQKLLAAAESAPDLATLKADMARLQAQFSEAQKKQAALASELSGSQAARAARDQVLGFTQLKTAIQQAVQEAEAIAQQTVTAQSEMTRLEQQVAHTEAQLLKLRQWEGQIWLIPDTSATSKEPMVVFVDGAGATIQRVDHPELRQRVEKATANSAFKAILATAKSLDQYVVFEVKPSGIDLFEELVNTAREMGFEVGYDALEEDKNPHLSSLPPDDESAPPAAPARAPATNTSYHSPPPAAPTATLPRATPPASPPNAVPQNKSWWQKLLEWVGFR